MQSVEHESEVFSTPNGSEPQLAAPAPQRSWLKLLLGFGLAVVLIGWLLRKQDLGRLQAALLRAQISLLLLAECVRIFQHFLKAQRWGFAVRQVTKEDKVHGVFRATMIGFLGNLLFPARLGELLRVQIFRKNNPTITRSLALTCSLLAQMFDFLLLLFLLGLGFSLGNSADVEVRRVFAVFGGLAFFVLLLLAYHRFFAWFQRLADVLFRPFPERLQTTLRAMMEQVHQALGLLRQWKSVLIVLLWTCVIWGLELVILWIALYAFGLPISWKSVVLLTAGLSFAFLLPLTPGALGAHQMVAIWVLAQFAVAKENAMALSLGMHGLDLCMVMLLGFLCFYREGLRFREVQQTTPHSFSSESS